MKAQRLKVAGLAALWLSTLVIALVGGWHVMYRISYVVLLLVVLSLAWALIAARTMKIERRSRTQRAQVGGHFEEWIAVDNTSFLPKPWVELHSDSNLTEHSVRRGFFLGPKSRRSWTLRTQCTSRGKFTLGDIVVSTGDPFGLFTQEVRFPSSTTVVVYPRTVDFVAPGHVPGQLPGGAEQRGQVPFVTPTAAGVRDYQPSDAYSRIHWRTTARLGRLMVKEFELDPFSDIWVVLDLDGRWHHGHGPESTEEYSVTAAASLAKHFLMQNRSVGLLAQREVLPPDRGIRQLTKVLELLAVVRAERRDSLTELLSAESMRLSRLATVVVVTPSVDGSWVTVCQHLAERNVKVLVALVESATFGSGIAAIDVVGSLAAANVPTYLVKRGEPLEALLTQPHEAGARTPDWVTQHA